MLIYWLANSVHETCATNATARRAAQARNGLALARFGRLQGGESYSTSGPHMQPVEDKAA
jgi:hypothetical protein